MLLLYLLSLRHETAAFISLQVNMLSGEVHSCLRVLVGKQVAAQTAPSQVARVALCAARQVRGLHPRWPGVLKAATGVTDPVKGQDSLYQEALAGVKQ